MSEYKVLAIDLGASSGRGIIGSFDGGKITLEEIHRFSNDPVNINGAFMWDILRIFFEIKNAIRKCAGRNIQSIGIDTWGVDFGLLDKYGNLMENPYHYRDTRTDNIDKTAYDKISRQDMYNINGLQYLPFNSIFQLLSLAQNRPEILDGAKDMLFTPDLLNYFLTGIKSTEYTIASTSGLLDAKKRTWSKDLLKSVGIPDHILGNIVQPGNILGTLSPEVLSDAGGVKAKVVNVGSHDTASAVAAVPAAGDDFVYISSGTWSLMGVESNEPIITDKSAEYDFTNEGGVCGTIRVLKNVMGLWLSQESRRQWERDGEEVPSFNELEKMAGEAQPNAAIIDADAPEFMPAGDMPARILDYCRRHGQHVPQNKGELIRCIFDSLAVKYNKTLSAIDELKGTKTKYINIVGGGTKEDLLNQLTADVCGIPVHTGPVEATALGNILVQLMSAGEISNLKEGREVIRKSFDVKVYEPKPQTFSVTT